MATLKEITGLCKNGQVQDAYLLAKADWENDIDNVWTQREVGWALYYMIKEDVVSGNYDMLQSHLEEFRELKKLEIPGGDDMIAENVLWQVASFVNKKISNQDHDAFVKLSSLFVILSEYDFSPSTGYSFLLQCFMKFAGWSELLQFFEWWNFNKFLSKDYEPFKIENKKEILSLAERAYIAKSKELLKRNEENKTRDFLPQLKRLMDSYPQMVYPSYCYAKLLLSLGDSKFETLESFLPFARKKSSEFWVWDLFSDMFDEDMNKKMACLQRAIHCHTKEDFLGKVRIKLANAYVQTQQYDLAKYQIETIVSSCSEHNRNLPEVIKQWMTQPWFLTVASKGKSPLDYKSITDDILSEGTTEAMAIVTYVDDVSKKAFLVYGKEKRMTCKLPFKVSVGDVVRINYVSELNGRVRVLKTTKTSIPINHDAIKDYIKEVSGEIIKNDKDFAFLKYDGGSAFVSPNVVSKYGLENGDSVQATLVYDYNKKKDSWNWVCVQLTE